LGYEFHHIRTFIEPNAWQCYRRNSAPSDPEFDDLRIVHGTR